MVTLYSFFAHQKEPALRVSSSRILFLVVPQFYCWVLAPLMFGSLSREILIS